MTEQDRPTPRAIFDARLLPPPIEITDYSGNSRGALRIEQLSVYGATCHVDHTVAVATSETNLHDSLNPREELSVLLGAVGLTVNTTAQFLSCSDRTVQTNRIFGLRRLEARGTHAMEIGTRRLVQKGILSFDETVQLPYEIDPALISVFEKLSRGQSLGQVAEDGIFSEAGKRLSEKSLKYRLLRFRQKNKLQNFSPSLGVLLGLGAGLISPEDAAEPVSPEPSPPETAYRVIASEVAKSKETSPKPPFNKSLLPHPVEITGYEGANITDLQLHGFSLYGVRYSVNHQTFVSDSEHRRRRLSPRQELNLILGALGLTEEMASQFLYSSVNTIKANRQHGLQRLGAKGKASMEAGTRQLVEQGVLTSEGTIELPYHIEPLTAAIFQGLSEGKTIKQQTNEGLRSPIGEPYTLGQVQANLVRFRNRSGLRGFSTALGVLIGIGAGFIELDTPSTDSTSRA